MGCTLADEVGHLGHSKEVEASFDMGEEDSQGNLMGVHMLGDMAADNSLIMAIIEVVIKVPSVQLSHSFFL
jgi:hypothetical protein